MSEASRRFTDREVAMVLKKASEIDESGDAGASGGLSLEDLTDIAGEVGISEVRRERTKSSSPRGRPRKRSTGVLESRATRSGTRSRIGVTQARLEGSYRRSGVKHLDRGGFAVPESPKSARNMQQILGVGP
jgi:hypothetical protein